MVGSKIPLTWLKKDILSHAHTDLTCAHHIIEQHKKNSHDHGWFVFIGRQLPCSRHHQNLHLTHRDLSFCYRTIPRHSAIFFWPIFDAKRPHTTTRGHVSPHPQPTTIWGKFVFILLFFIKDALCIACLTLPPFIYLVEYASSAAATAHKPLGAEQTHSVPVKPPLPLWWQPVHRHKIPPKSCMP